MEKGIDVFRNAGCTGEADLVLKVGTFLMPVDVKQMAWSYKRGAWYAANGTARATGVWGVAVNPETLEVRWYQKHGGGRGSFAGWQCPPGFEDLWDD
tara:strand:- start:236 stop:526 length:291 start_codon:yes stop_codon:yes gene_type:complete